MDAVSYTHLYVMVETVAGSAGYLAKSTMENVMGRKNPPGQDV